MDIFYYIPWLFPALATLLGLIIGSFLNVVIYRLPTMMQREWRQECADAFPDYGITPLMASSRSVHLVQLALNVIRLCA